MRVSLSPARASLAALLVVAAEGLAALGGWTHPLSALAVLLVAPGLAALPFLPAELRAPAVRFAVVPVLGALVSAVVIVTLSSLELPLTALTVRLAFLALALASLVGSLRTPAPNVPRAGSAALEASALLLLGAAACAGVAVQSLVLGDRPLPGQDWGAYLLYAEEIARQGAVAIDNPYWMLGMPFPQDPGAPSLYGALLLLSSAAPTVLLEGIWIFALLAVLSVFVLVATLFGWEAGVLAAALYAVVPMNVDMLAWHGVANTFALAILPLALLAAGMAARGRLERRWAVLLGLSVVGLAAAHRLSFVVGLAALVLPAVGVVVRHRARGLRFGAWAALAALALGAGVIADVVRRNAAIGGVQVQDASVYLATKIQWDFVLNDLTRVLAAAGALALAGLLVLPRFRRDPGRLAILGLGAALLVLGHAWIVDVPMVYHRVSFYLPLLLAPAIAAAAAAYRPRAALVVGAALVAAVALHTRDLAPGLRDFYTYANPASLRGLELVDAELEPGDVVVTDACWGFLAFWLLRQPVVAALDPVFIVPEAELEGARLARRILYGPRGETAARRIGARYALVDPKCSDTTIGALGPPTAGEPVYASSRLLVLDLEA